MGHSKNKVCRLGHLSEVVPSAALFVAQNVTLWGSTPATIVHTISFLLSTDGWTATQACHPSTIAVVMQHVTALTNARMVFGVNLMSISVRTIHRGCPSCVMMRAQKLIMIYNYCTLLGSIVASHCWSTFRRCMTIIRKS